MINIIKLYEKEVPEVSPIEDTSQMKKKGEKKT